MMNRWLSMSGLVLSILAIFVAAWLLLLVYGWLRLGKAPSVGVAVFAVIVGGTSDWLPSWPLTLALCYPSALRSWP